MDGKGAGPIYGERAGIEPQEPHRLPLHGLHPLHDGPAPRGVAEAPLGRHAPRRKGSVSHGSRQERETTEPVIPYKIPRSRALQRDLEALGIAFRNEFGKMDFHSLRHSCATMLARYGVAPNVAQQILRHHDVRLTLATYTHTNGEAISSELTKVPRQLDICTTHYTPHVVSEGHSAALDGKSNVAVETAQPADSAVFSLDLSARDTARQKGKMVGVTGFEPATSTSRT